MDVDRAAAADLLRAKQRVEAGLAAGALSDGFAADVETLLEATRDALSDLGVSSPACPA